MKIFPRIRALFQKRHLEAEMAEEMRLHREQRVEEHLAEGMSPEEARFAAQREFGHADGIKEAARAQRGVIWLEQLGQDLRYAAGGLLKAPGFTTVVVLSLGLGIGANTAAFSLAYEHLLKALPVRNPAELMSFDWVPGPAGGFYERSIGAGTPEIDPGTGRGVQRVFSAPDFERLREAQKGVVNLIAFFALGATTVVVDGEPEQLDQTEIVSGNYFEVLGLGAFLGRPLRSEDDRPGAEPVTVLTYDYWRSRFNADPAVIGRTIQVNRAAVTIVGVMPPGFFGTTPVDGHVGVELPVSLAPRVGVAELGNPRTGWLRLMGRRVGSATPEQAASALQGTFVARLPEGALKSGEFPQLRAHAARDGRTEPDRQESARIVRLLLGIVILVLIAASANVANLLLTRGAARRREIAVRLALGAGRLRLVRQLLTEGILLSLLGAVAGIIFAHAGLDLLMLAVIPEERNLFSLKLDPAVLAYTVGLAGLTGVVCSLAPAFRSTRLNLSAEFHGGARMPGRAGHHRLSQGLLIVQVAVSLVLLVGAGLLMRTVGRLQAVDVGFNFGHVLLLSVDGSSARYDVAQSAALYGRIVGEVAKLPGVTAATYTDVDLLDGNFNQLNVTVPGYVAAPGEKTTMERIVVGPDFFTTFQIPLREGRALDARDTAASSRVVVVNEAFAKKYFGGVPPLGRQIQVGRETREVVGVARDIRSVELRQPAVPTCFLPFVQRLQSGRVQFSVRTATDPAAMLASIRKAVARVDPDLPLFRVRTLEQQIEWHLAEERVFAGMTTILGAVALLLTSVGLFGLMSFLVIRRTSEIGIRMALGALPRSILWMILRESLFVAALGVAVGLGASAFAMPAISRLLFALSPTDPATYAGVALLLLGVVGLACWLPARRAAKVDPMVALRSE